LATGFEITRVSSENAANSAALLQEHSLSSIDETDTALTAILDELSDFTLN